MSKMQEYISAIKKLVLESWDLSDGGVEIYVPIVKQQSGTQAVFIELDSIKNTKTIRIFVKEDEAYRYRLSKQKYSVIMIRTKVSSLIKQMARYMSKDEIKMQCVVCTYDVNDELHELYTLWTNVQN